MATTIPRLLDEMAEAGIRTRKELAWLARHMKKTIAQGKHGKAADAATADAASLFIAAMSTASATKVEDAVRRIGDATIGRSVEFAYSLGPDRKPITFEVAAAGSSFEVALKNLIDLRRHPDIHTADLAGNVAQIGLRESTGEEWPWLEFKRHPGLDSYANDQASGRFVFGDFAAYAMSARGMVRETTIGTLALYRVSSALGLEWQKA